MENYELTLVLPSKSKAKEKTLAEKLEKIVKVLEGKLVKTEIWGELDLAYQIKKESTGYFMHFILELNKSAVKGLDDKLRLEDDLLRYLLVRSK